MLGLAWPLPTHMLIHVATRQKARAREILSICVCNPVAFMSRHLQTSVRKSPRHIHIARCDLIMDHQPNLPAMTQTSVSAGIFVTTLGMDVKVVLADEGNN